MRGCSVKVFIFELETRGPVEKQCRFERGQSHGRDVRVAFCHERGGPFLCSHRSRCIFKESDGEWDCEREREALPRLASPSCSGWAWPLCAHASLSVRDSVKDVRVIYRIHEIKYF